MDTGSRTPGEAEGGAIAPPTWTHGLVALAGVALLIGPTLLALWPR